MSSKRLFKTQFAQARRYTLISQSVDDKKHYNTNKLLQWKKRYNEKRNETIRQNHEDSIRHLQVGQINFFFFMHKKYY